MCRFCGCSFREEPLTTLNINPNVSHLWLYIHRKKKKKQTFVVTDTEASATKADHEMSQIKKLKVSQPTRGKIPHHSHTTILPFGLDLIGAKCIFMK